jgi:hypothetical protein
MHPNLERMEYYLARMSKPIALYQFSCLIFTMKTQFFTKVVKIVLYISINRLQLFTSS